MQRDVEVRIGDKWLLLNGIQNLRKGQYFRMWEPDGKPVINNGENVFKALSDPYWSDTDDTWMIDIETELLH